MDYSALVKNVVIPKIKKFGTEYKLITKAQDLGDWEKIYDVVAMQYKWVNKTTKEEKFEQPQESELQVSIRGLADTISVKDIDGTFIKAGDIKLYLDPAIEPSYGDVIEVNNKRYSIYHYDPIKPALTTLLYIVYIRSV